VDELERLIKAARDLRDLGATSVSVRLPTPAGCSGHGASIDATFAPLVVTEPEAAEPTADEIAAERERTLMHSAS
jgi:hypothetical protein